MENKEYLSIELAADFLEISKRTLYKKAEDGVLPFIQHSERGKIYFKKSDLINYLESGRQMSINN